MLVNLNLIWVDAQNCLFKTTQISINTFVLFGSLGKLTVNSQWGLLFSHMSGSHVGVHAMLLTRSITPTHRYSTEGWNIPPMCDWLTQARSMNVKIHLELWLNSHSNILWLWTLSHWLFGTVPSWRSLLTNWFMQAEACSLLVSRDNQTHQISTWQLRKSNPNLIPWAG